MCTEFSFDENVEQTIGNGARAIMPDRCAQMASQDLVNGNSAGNRLIAPSTFPFISPEGSPSRFHVFSDEALRQINITVPSGSCFANGFCVRQSFAGMMVPLDVGRPVELSLSVAMLRQKSRASTMNATKLPL
jgi:hypothetical protein